MKKLLYIAILTSCFVACKKYSDMKNTNDVVADGVLNGRLFLTDTLTKNLIDVPQSGKRITLRYSNVPDTINYLFETTTDANGYFVFKNLRKDSAYTAKFDEKIDNISYYAIDHNGRTPTYDSIMLFAEPNSTNQNGLIYSVMLNSNRIKGATVCLFSNNALFQNGGCEGALYSTTSTELGKAAFMNINPGEYFVRVQFSASGRTFSAHDTVSITQRSVLQERIALTAPAPAPILEFLVTDPLGGKLNGATLCLFSSELYLETDTCAGSNFSTQTNSGGIAVFQNLPVGTHYLFAQWKSGPIDLKSKQAIMVTAEMRKDTLVLQ